MKLAPREAARTLARPATDLPGLLIYGADPTRVAIRRQEAVAGIVGGSGEAEMRVAHLTPADLRESGARVLDEVRSPGLYPGRRAVVVEQAADGYAPAFAAALSEWREGDACLVVTAGSLTPRSALRKLFEQHRSALALAVYEDPPDRAEVERLLAEAGLQSRTREADEALHALAAGLEPGEWRQTLTRIGLYKHDDPEPLSGEEVALLAPAAPSAAVDELTDAIAEGAAGRIAPLLRRLSAQGHTPVSICLAVSRHFRTLIAAAADPGGAAAALSRMRPPVFGPRRDRMRRQAQEWSGPQLDQALQLATETDLALRSSRPLPEAALLERALIRMAMLRR